LYFSKEKDMNKKNLVFNGCNITYYENESNGPTLLFVHGNSLAAETYKNQYENQDLNGNYHLIAPDLPGHGESGKATDPDEAYTLSGFVDFIVDFVKALDIRNAVFVGHSLGGHILMDAWEKIEDRANGLVIFGSPPITIPIQMEHSHYENPAFEMAFKEKLSDEEIQTLSKAFIKPGAEVPPVITETIKKADPVMRPILVASTTPEKVKNEAEIIHKMKKPIAIFQGKEDQLLKHTYYELLDIPTLWRQKLHLIENTGHCPQIENPEKFNELLIHFLEEI
jgi:pimeloyl-ACP methyl ester carboxylesterase